MRVLITELKDYFYEPSCHITTDQVPRIASNWPKVERCLCLGVCLQTCIIYAKHIHTYYTWICADICKSKCTCKWTDMISADLHLNMQLYFEMHLYMLIGKILALANLAATCENEMTSSSLGLILYNAWKFANFCTGTGNPNLHLCLHSTMHWIGSMQVTISANVHNHHICKCA